MNQDTAGSGEFSSKNVRSAESQRSAAVNTIIMQRELFSFDKRLKLIETRFDSLRDHVGLIDENLIEKHKAALEQIKDVSDSLAEVKKEMDEVRRSLDRLISRSEVFVTRDSLKVLQKALDYWQPLDFVTRDEVEDMLKQKKK